MFRFVNHTPPFFAGVAGRRYAEWLFDEEVQWV